MVLTMIVSSLNLFFLLFFVSEMKKYLILPSVVCLVFALAVVKCQKEEDDRNDF